MATRTTSAGPEPQRASVSGRSRNVKRILNCLPSLKRESDWPAASAYDAGLLTAESIPSSKDLRESSWWTIGNQGLTGSCVGWASADSVIRWHLAMAGRIGKDRKKMLSPRYIWMAAKESDEFTSRPTSFIELDGTSLKAALDIARKFGVVLDSVLPFTGGTLYGGRADVFYALASTLRISGYFSLRQKPPAKTTRSAILTEWRRWLATGGPILTRLDVDDTWDSVGSDGKLTTYHASRTRGGHAVAMVGYEKDSFIVRNSWGTGWADRGYAYASNDYAFAAFTEAYGVVA
jgi:hypothetical protein